VLDRVYRAHRRSLEESAMPEYLRYEDRNSMASSIESRLPFLDHRLVSLAVTLPNEAKLHRAWTKRILRDALRGIVPDVILDRRDKMGFPTPHAHWMRNELAGAVAEAVHSSELRALEAVDLGQVSEMYRRWMAGEDGLGHALWRIVSVDLWLRAYGLAG